MIIKCIYSSMATGDVNFCGSPAPKNRRKSSPLMIFSGMVLVCTLLYYFLDAHNTFNVFSLAPCKCTHYSNATQEILLVHDDQNASTTTTINVAQVVVNTSSIEAELRETSEDVRLERVLKEAATEDKTVILTTLNDAWSEPRSMIDVFLESFKIGDGTQDLLNHLIIVAMDLKAFSRCRAIHHHCFALIPTDGVDFSKSERFMSRLYLQMMWRRTDFLRLVLEKGYNFIFTDADIMWFRNPFLHFDPDAEFQVACDDYKGDPHNVNNYANGGFMYVKSNNRTVAFYKHWYSLREKYPSSNEQDVLNKYIKYDSFVRDEIGVKLWFLHIDYFSDLCQPTKDLGKVCTMHSNCCLLGLDAKLHDLRIMLDDWSTYKERREDKKKKSDRYSWSLLKMKCG